jgi:hypothetical protein
MPAVLASGTTTVFSYEANITPPKDYKEWARLIERLVSPTMIRLSSMGSHVVESLALLVILNCGQMTSAHGARKGSKIRLWNEQSVARAIDYVLNGQGDDLPDFD